MKKCEKIKRDASLKLMEMTAESCQRKLDQLNSEQVTFETFDSNYLQNMEEAFRKVKDKKFKGLKRRKSKTESSAQNTEMNVIKVKGDGNCFYRCISKWKYGSEEKHGMMRREIVDFITNNQTQYAVYIDGDVRAHIEEQRFTDGRLSSWATEAEVFAAASLFKTAIFIHGDGQILTFKPQTEVPCVEEVHVRLNGGHFDLLSKGENTRKVQSRESNGDIDWFDISTPEVAKCPENGTANWSDERNTTEPETHVRAERAVTAKTTKSTRTEPKTVNRNNNNKSEQVVTNLSSRKFTQAEEKLLSKGLTFIPTQRKIDVWRVHSDLAEWERRMRLREYFANKEPESDEDDSSSEEHGGMEFIKKKKKSTFTPKPGRDKWLDAYIEAVKKDVIDGIKQKVEMNITNKEEMALKSILMDDTIIIRPADKGSGIVVMDTESYITGLEKEVENSKSYVRTSDTKYQEAEKLVKRTVSGMYKKGHISSEMRRYMIPKTAKSGRLKGNPKLHKKGNPMRTIVSGIGTPTEQMAEVAEKELEEYVTQSPSYIQDTTDFLRKLDVINHTLPKGAILFCFDVEKLYPSIPKKEGLAACKDALEQRKRKRIETNTVLEMIETVLENNVFSFNGKQYIQTDGVAIGSRLGRNYACTYMRQWDDELGKFQNQPMLYYRYIDDGFGIWLHGEESLKEFQNYANNIHPNINVELRYSSDKIEFLDTMVILENGHIITDLYTKPTDKHIYVDRKSSHPSNVKKSLPYGLGIRLRRICSRDSDYIKRRGELKSYLRKRGYSSKFIETQLTKVDRLKRSDLLQYKQKNNNQKRVPLVVTYSRHLPDLHKISRDHMPLLHKSPEMQRIFLEPPLIAYRRDRNLNDILVHGKHNRIFKTREDSGRCPNENCTLCPIMIRGEEASELRTKPVDPRNNCKTTNVVYGLYCELCKKVVYVGETERTTGERVKEHLADIKHKREKAVAIHFNAEEHTLKDLKFLILERCTTNSCYYRRARENFWIDHLNTLTPHGINQKSQFGILWPDFLVERDSAHNNNAMTSREARRRTPYTKNAARECTDGTRQNDNA